jgi:hypothetical protein
MRVPIFIVAAVVLIVFAIVASAGTTGLLFGTTAVVWAYASFLAFLANLVFGGWGYANGAWGRGDRERASGPMA